MGKISRIRLHTGREAGINRQELDVLSGAAAPTCKKPRSGAGESKDEDGQAEVKDEGADKAGIGVKAGDAAGHKIHYLRAPVS